MVRWLWLRRQSGARGSWIEDTSSDWNVDMNHKPGGADNRGYSWVPRRWGSRRWGSTLVRVT